MIFKEATIREAFPMIAKSQMNGHPLAYLDSAATAQKPQCVIDAVTSFYSEHYSSINRGVYELAEKTTQVYESARKTVAHFIGSPSPDRIVFTSGATESINLVAHGLAANYFEAGHEIILTQMEHHANIVPWQQAAKQTGAIIRVAPLTLDGELDLLALEKLITDKTKLIAIIHVSNVLGSVVSIQSVTALAQEKEIPVLVDGAQAVAHLAVDVKELGCDFYVFSAHKLYGPTGVGVLYAKPEWLERMPPYQTGGDMIRRVSFENTIFAEPPQKFEAGTPNIAGVLGLAEAIRYFTQFTWADKEAHEKNLITYLDERLRSMSGIQVYGPIVSNRKSVTSFVVDNIHAHDLGSFLGNEGVAVRVGHHCAMPLMTHLGISAATRASLGIYSNRADLDAFFLALEKARQFFC